jgi:probable phosphoglycerate mutase
MFLLQFDACNRDYLNIGSIGYVIYYHNNVLIKKYKILNNALNSNYAEYKALIEGLKNAIKLNIKDLYVEGDAKIVIEQINNNCNVKSESVKPLYKEVLTLLKYFDTINFNHIYRKQNIYADSLANQALIDYFFQSK